MLATAIKPYKMPYSEHIPKGAIIKTLMWGMRTGGDVGALRTNKEESISNYSKEMYQHLYFVDDSDINEGDWYYWPVTRSVLRFKMTEIERKRDNPHPSKDCKKIIATTDKRIKNQMLLDGFDRIYPQPSKSFIEKYCKLGGIDEVMVELTEWGVGFGHDKNGIELPLRLKVNSHNEIAIHTIKDNWSRDEVNHILRDFSNVMGLDSSYVRSYIKENI